MLLFQLPGRQPIPQLLAFLLTRQQLLASRGRIPFSSVSSTTALLSSASPSPSSSSSYSSGSFPYWQIYQKYGENPKLLEGQDQEEQQTEVSSDEYQIHQISPQETLPLREAVLWPGRPEMCLLPQDEEGIHLGYYIVTPLPQTRLSTTTTARNIQQNDKKNDMVAIDDRVARFTLTLVGVVSLFLVKKPHPPTCAAQFRKLAVHPDWQGRGIGTALVEATMDYTKRFHFYQAREEEIRHDLLANGETKDNEESSLLSGWIARVTNFILRNPFSKQQPQERSDDTVSHPSTTIRHHDQQWQPIGTLFCDARAHQAPFYERLGFQTVGEPFVKYPSKNISIEGAKEASHVDDSNEKTTDDTPTKYYVRMELALPEEDKETTDE